MRNEKYAIWPLGMAESPKLLHSLAMELGYGADTMFHRTYF